MADAIQLLNKMHPDSGEYSVAKMLEQHEWEFKKDFVVEAEGMAAELILEGVDTYADVYLNGKPVQRCDNAFHPWKIDISKAIQKGNNTLLVSFSNPVIHDLPKAKKLHYSFPADGGKTTPFTRKPALHFGWDFAKRMVNCRVASARVEQYREFEILDVQYTTEWRENKVVLKTTASIESKINAKAKLSFHFGSNDDRNRFVTDQELRKGLNVKTLIREFKPDDIQLWWPNGMGESFLYSVSFDCVVNGLKEKRSDKIGFRKFEVDQSHDKWGESFQFVVNDQRIFARGFNYISTEKEITEAEVKHWKELNVNMIRIWGGATYGSNRLYQLCDAYGILIWQDFMFGNTMYPGDKDFLNSVSEEASYQLKRLRNHPSLALYSGNNEIEVAWKNWGWDKTYHYTSRDKKQMQKSYKKLFKTLLPTLVNELDPDRFYLSSSPISNWGKAEDFNSGDNHFWGVFHGDMPIEAYNTHIPRFASEYGMQSYSMNFDTTILNMAYSDAVNNAFTWAQHCYKGNKNLEKYQQQSGLKFTSVRDFIRNSQIVQAEAMRIAIEAHRRNMDKCAGSIVWQWNDVDESASWSMIDVNGKPKLVHSVLKRAFAPVLLSKIIVDGKIQIYVINDIPLEEDLQLKWTEGADERGRIFNIKDLGSRMILELPVSEKASKFRLISGEQVLSTAE